MSSWYPSLKDMLYKRRMERQLAAARGEASMPEKPPDEDYVSTSPKAVQTPLLPIQIMLSDAGVACNDPTKHSQGGVAVVSRQSCANVDLTKALAPPFYRAREAPCRLLAANLVDMSHLVDEQAEQPLAAAWRVTTCAGGMRIQCGSPTCQRIPARMTCGCAKLISTG